MDQSLSSEAKLGSPVLLIVGAAFVLWAVHVRLKPILNGLANAFKALYGVYSNPISKVPGPWYSKWTEWVLKYYLVKGLRSHYVHKLHQQHGNLPFSSGHYSPIDTRLRQVPLSALRQPR